MDLEQKEQSAALPEPDPEPAVTIPATEMDAPEADPSLCPRCDTKLTNPDGLGWCPSCGYCRSLEDEGKALPAPKPAAAKKPSALGATEFGEVVKQMPRWAWPLIAGIVGLVGASVATDLLLPEDCLARALWSAIQMVLGVIGLISAQMWAVMIVGDKEEGLGARDLILPGRVWRATFRRLPATRKVIWLGAWSLTALICGAAVIGGFNYWLELVQQGRIQRLADKLASQDTVKATSRDWTREFRPPAKTPVKMDEDNRPITQCVVIGYQTDGKTVTGIVLAMAEPDSDTLSFAGVIRDGLTPELRDELMTRLSRLKRKGPLIPGLDVKGTFWVNPGVFCNIIRPNGGKASEGNEPEFKELSD